jgi:adenine-specific DNA-methyltransferase
LAAPGFALSRFSPFHGIYEWYEIQDNTAYWKEFEQPKIVYPDIAYQCHFALDKSSLYPDATLYLIPRGSLYLLGILNSSVNKFFFPQICPKIRGGFMRFKSIYVEQIPIPNCVDPRPVEKLVNDIWQLKKMIPKLMFLNWNAKLTRLSTSFTV